MPDWFLSVAEGSADRLHEPKTLLTSLPIINSGQRRALILKVKDNGCGITSEAEAREGFGFANMRARVKKLKGTLEIRTAPGRGTTIVVSVPLNVVP